MRVDLPEPEIPVMTESRPIGKSRVDVLQIISVRVADLEPLLDFA